MKRSLFCTGTVVALTFTFATDRAKANHFYNFEEFGTGTVLATLHLASGVGSLGTNTFAASDPPQPSDNRRRPSSHARANMPLL